jgi:hypothetical protein
MITVFQEHNNQDGWLYLKADSSTIELWALAPIRKGFATYEFPDTNQVAQFISKLLLTIGTCKFDVTPITPSLVIPSWNACLVLDVEPFVFFPATGRAVFSSFRDAMQICQSIACLLAEHEEGTFDDRGWPTSMA